jgi:hypothetical protein
MELITFQTSRNTRYNHLIFLEEIRRNKLLVSGHLATLIWPDSSTDRIGVS